MDISSSTLSLFNYIGDDNSTANDVLQKLAQGNHNDINGGLDILENGLNNGAYEETLALMENGEIDVDLNIVENYYLFNQQKLDREVAQLAKTFELQPEVTVTLQDGQLLVEGDADNHKALQQYLDKDTRLSALVQQTAKFSQFLEWGEAKSQAAEYQSENISEEQLLDFLQEARLVMTQDNHFIMSEIGSTFYSKGHTQQVIDNFESDTE